MNGGFKYGAENNTLVRKMKGRIYHSNAWCVSFISLELAFANISTMPMTGDVYSEYFKIRRHF